MRSETEHAVSIADERDRNAIGAAEKLSSVQKPPTPGPFQTFTPTDFEVQFQSLYYISDGLTIAHLSRLSAAKDAWKSALALNKTNSDFYGNEYSEVIWPTNIGIDYSNAVTRLPMVAQQIPAINALGKFASSQDDTLQGPYADLKQVLRDRLNETLALYDEIALWSNKPRISFIFRLPKLPPHLPVISLD